MCAVCTVKPALLAHQASTHARTPRGTDSSFLPAAPFSPSLSQWRNRGAWLLLLLDSAGFFAHTRAREREVWHTHTQTRAGCRRPDDAAAVPPFSSRLTTRSYLALSCTQQDLHSLPLSHTQVCPVESLSAESCAVCKSPPETALVRAGKWLCLCAPRCATLWHTLSTHIYTHVASLALRALPYRRFALRHRCCCLLLCPFIGCSVIAAAAARAIYTDTRRVSHASAWPRAGARVVARFKKKKTRKVYLQALQRLLYDTLPI